MAHHEPVATRRSGPRSLLLWPIALLVFGFAWLLRFNDPGGAFAGLTDDHFFYLVRGWQILFGDLPVRDFVDHGAPLYYYVGAAVQMLFGRGTVSELAFSTTMLAAGAALVYWLSARASGSLLVGFVGAAFHVFLYQRFYNYPKVLAYATAIPLIWWFVNRPGPRRGFAVALATVIWFLFRHDHGAFIAVAMIVALAFLTDLPWRTRVRHGATYGLFVILLLAPYLVFVERNGGVVAYFRQASEWAERDRYRAPVVWPGLFENPNGVSDEARSSTGLTRAVATVRDNGVAWTFYGELCIPLLALLVLAMSPDAFRPGWTRARVKLLMVAVLGLVVDAGFLRSPLEARLADPSVPLAILLAWLVIALPQAWFRRSSLPTRTGAVVVRAASVAVGLPLLFVLVTILGQDFYEKLDSAAMTERVGKMFERADRVAGQVRMDWSLETWVAREERPDLITLSLYVNACTKPTDRVLVQGYLPQVLALARRAFAGGHADLRPGFFRGEDAQRLTLARLQRQSVPVILLETDESYRNFRKSFPLVTAYIDEHYQLAATHVFDRRFGVTLFVRRELTPSGVWEPLGWPCYGTGRVSSS